MSEYFPVDRFTHGEIHAQESRGLVERWRQDVNGVWWYRRKQHGEYGVPAGVEVSEYDDSARLDAVADQHREEPLDEFFDYDNALAELDRTWRDKLDQRAEAAMGEYERAERGILEAEEQLERLGEGDTDAE